jgi:hypothetical protein
MASKKKVATKPRVWVLRLGKETALRRLKWSGFVTFSRIVVSIPDAPNSKMFALVSPNLATNQLERWPVVLGRIGEWAAARRVVPPILGPSARGLLFLRRGRQKEKTAPGDQFDSQETARQVRDVVCANAENSRTMKKEGFSYEYHYRTKDGLALTDFKITTCE